MSYRRPEIFVSATSADLRTCRQLVKEALLTLGCMPVEQSNFPPDYRRVRDMLRSRIQASDAVVHIAGECYGAEPGTRPSHEPRRSYTQMEFDLARELRKPLYVFLCGDGFPYDSHAAEDPEKQELQRAHRALLGASETMRTKVTSRDDLALRVRELQTHVDNLTQELRRTRSWLGRGVAAALVVLLGLTGVVWLLKVRAERAEAHTAHVERELADVRALLTTVVERYNQQAAPGEELSPAQRLERAVTAVAGETKQDAAGLQSKLESFMGRVAQDPDANLHDRALAQFAAQDFTGAAASAQAAAKQFRAAADAAEHAGRAEESRHARTRESAALIVAGDAFKALQRYAEAAEAYRAAGAHGDKTAAWADAQWGLGYALFGQSRAAGDWASRARLLRQALACYEAAAEIRTRHGAPREWARLQYHVSLALADLAALTPMPEYATLWQQVVSARRAALEILTHADTPAEWAWVQVELGHALIPYAWTAEGSERTERLAASIAAYRAVLAVTSGETQPESWLQLQGFLAQVLRYFGWGASEPGRSAAREESARIYRAMLEMQPRATRPMEWATTQSNLGFVLCDAVEKQSGLARADLLASAEAAQRASLEVFTREATPQQWAASQHGLAYVLVAQATVAVGDQRTALLKESVAAYRAALEVVTPAIDQNRYQTLKTQLAGTEAMLGQQSL